MKEANVLIIADKKDSRILDIDRQSTHWNIVRKVVDYQLLHKAVDELHHQIVDDHIDFVLYSRNDQVGNRTSIGPITSELRIGYSSFSGIDIEQQEQQMISCFDDFFNCDKSVDFALEEKEPSNEKLNGKGTFSLIFDTEQLGCAKYGLPRLFNILNKYNVQATFFVTNITKRVYSNVDELITKQGHELGLHGLWHEYLSDLDSKSQTSLIAKMAKGFGAGFYGVNFIGRMNDYTLDALIENRSPYFVSSSVNYYRYSHYPKFCLSPKTFERNGGKILMLPIGVETYSFPWLSVKNMLDSAINQSKYDRFPHLSILCHPFRDGNLSNIAKTEKLLRYLTKEKGLTSITLKKLTDKIIDNVNFQTESSLQSLSHSKSFASSFPKTRQDFIGFIPENALKLYKLSKRHQTVF